MKNKIKLVGIIAIAAIIGLSMAGCKKGGTLEIENKTGGKISAAVVSEGTTPVDYEEIANDTTRTWTFGDNGDIHFYWIGKESGINSTYSGDGIAPVEKGGTYKVTARLP